MTSKRTRPTTISPNPFYATRWVVDRTPAPVTHFSFSERGALLAKIRHNNLVGLFLGLDVYSIQCCASVNVRRIGQIEIDEVYVGLDRSGRQFVVPVQAKGGGDKLNVVQTKQDIACCSEKFPGLICRALSAQFVEADRIALFELTLEDGAIKIADEAHYQLLPADQISLEELAGYRLRKL